MRGYADRIEHHARLELVELAAAGAPSSEAARRKEGQELLRRAGTEAWLIALDERGTPLDPRFARPGAGTLMGRDVTFVLGGDRVSTRRSGNGLKVISLSTMTLPHRLARLVLMSRSTGRSPCYAGSRTTRLIAAIASVGAAGNAPR